MATIRDVIRIARELTDASGAIVDRDSILPAFAGRLDKTEEAFLSSPNLASAHLPYKLVSVDHCILEPTVSALNIKSIAVLQSGKPLDLRNALYGYVLNDPIQPKIVIRPDLRPCWERFTIAKELLHLYSRTSDDKGVAESSTLIQAAKDSRTLIVSEATELDDETFGFYLAIEVMLPWCLRDQLLFLKHSCNATTMQIAKVFMVPQCLVEHVYSDATGHAGSYLALSRRLNLNL